MLGRKPNSIDPNEQLFLALVRPNLNRLNAVARRYVRNPADVSDLVQETLLRAWRNFSPTDDRTYARAWLLVILRNVALEWRRRSASRIRLTFVPDAELTELMPPDQREPFSPLPAMSEERFKEFLDDRVLAALESLDAPFQEVVILSVAGGLSYADIAQVLDCPIGTVMSRMGRARRTLRERLSQGVEAKAQEQPK